MSGCADVFSARCRRNYFLLAESRSSRHPGPVIDDFAAGDILVQNERGILLCWFAIPMAIFNNNYGCLRQNL